MGDGTRDAFVENDVIGNYAVGSKPIYSVAGSRRRKSRKKHRRNMSILHKRRLKSRNIRRHHSRRHHKRSSGIKYTKNGQPYKIMSNGRARFLKK